MDWRPIETAPKDGTPVLLWLKDKCDRNYTVTGLCDYFSIGIWLYGRWNSIDVEDCGTMGGECTGWMPDWCCIAVNPSHWMPLPEPPNAP